MAVRVSLTERLSIEGGGVVVGEQRFPRQGRLVFAYLLAADGKPVPEGRARRGALGGRVTGEMGEGAHRPRQQAPGSAQRVRRRRLHGADERLWVLPADPATRELDRHRRGRRGGERGRASPRGRRRGCGVAQRVDRGVARARDLPARGGRSVGQREARGAPGDPRTRARVSRRGESNARAIRRQPFVRPTSSSSSSRSGRAATAFSCKRNPLPATTPRRCARMSAAERSSPRNSGPIPLRRRRRSISRSCEARRGARLPSSIRATSTAHAQNLRRSRTRNRPRETGASWRLSPPPFCSSRESLPPHSC